MDVAAFSDDNFDVKDWINKTFKSAEAQENKDAFVSSLVMKLQLYVQQVNGALEETSQSVLSGMPRVLRDTQVLQQEALILRDKMVAVKQEIAKRLKRAVDDQMVRRCWLLICDGLKIPKGHNSELKSTEIMFCACFSSKHSAKTCKTLTSVEKDTGLSMVTLERIDRIKTDLQTAKQGLHEADNWTVLANDVEEVFESGDVEKIANKLYSMQKSLTMLANVLDYEDKKLQLEGLKNRLEAMASPKLVQAFTASSLEQSKTYVVIFGKIDRLPQLLKYYQNCLKVSLAQEWRKTIAEQVEQEETVVYWLRIYYDKLLSTWLTQVKWCNQVFPNSSIDTLVEVYADLLRGLSQNFVECIDSTLRQESSNSHLDTLIILKENAKEFAVNLSGAVEASSQGKSLSQASLLLLAEAIYAPYVSFVGKYSVYEKAKLAHELESLDCVREDLSDTINSLSLSISRAIDNANSANTRCKVFTAGCGYPGLLKALNTYFSQYLDSYKTGIRQLERKKIKQEDWNLFQMCLTLLQSIGELLGHVEEFEKILLADIVDANNKLQSTNNNAFTRYKELLLDTSGRKEFDSLITSLQKEDKTILDFVTQLIHKLCSDLHNTTYEVIFAPIFTQLLLVQKAPAWSSEANRMANLSSDLPDYSFAPQEYITQVGQYLMTLPQHLEPFLLRDNPSLTQALRAADPQYAQGSTESGFTDILLGIVAKGTCTMFQDQTLGICELNAGACKQLATDIDYLGNILEELGLSLTEQLQQTSTLLRLSPEVYQSGSSGCNARLVAAIRQMRNITSSG